MADSPTNRTKKWFESFDYTVGVVERWLPRTNIRVDLFGFADLAAMRDNGEFWLLQATDGSNHSKRRDKLLALDTVPVALAAGVRVAVVSWSKRGPRGKRKLWTCRIDLIVWEDYRLTYREIELSHPPAVD